MRVLVCGGRDYSAPELVHSALSLAHEDRGIEVIIHGGAKGVDSFAGEWADANLIPQEVYRADWSQGKKAGPIRNQRMLDEGKPDVVAAFPGGRGTADMVSRARRAGILVWLPYGQSNNSPDKSGV